MRIAFAMINCNRRDGSARAVNEVAERLAGRGHEVHLFARKAEDLDLAAVRWHRVPGPGWPEVADFASYHAAVNARLRRHDFDIVHSIGCNTLRANVVTIQNIQPAKKEILDRVGGAEAVSAPRRFTRWTYLRATCAAERKLYTRPRRPLLFLPVSRGVERELRAHYDIGEALVEIVPNAADTAMFHPRSADARAAWRRANGFQPADFIALFCGGEWARKGLEEAIRGVGLAPGVKLFVAGDDPDRGRYRRIAQDVGAGDRVVFGGFRRDIPEAMAAADIFLFPSHYEAFSLASIEAAACGLPIVATRINGTEDFIVPGETGEFISREPAAIAEVVARLAANPELRTRMGRNARESVERNYTWDRVTTMTEEAYGRIVAR
jgi:UDP-glucose:(heptosyl)LPS alpha-1,3-glucosyltransferase